MLTSLASYAKEEALLLVLMRTCYLLRLTSATQVEAV